MSEVAKGAASGAKDAVDDAFENPTPWMRGAFGYKRALTRSGDEVSAEMFVKPSQSIVLKYALGDGPQIRRPGDVGLARERILVAHWRNLALTQGINRNAYGNSRGGGGCAPGTRGGRHTGEAPSRWQVGRLQGRARCRGLAGITNLFGMVATCGACMKPMNYRDRGPRSTPVLRCSAERAGTCSNGYRIPYHDTEAAILLWLVKLDLRGGASGELARHEEALRTKTAERDELQARGEAIVRGIGDGSRFAKAPLAEIEADTQACEAAMADLAGKIAALRLDGGRDERSAAIDRLDDLQRRGASDEEVFAARMRIRQIIRDTFEAM